MEQPDRQAQKRNRWINSAYSIFSIVLSISAVILLFFHFESVSALNKGAYSEHMWRQADGHAMAYNYYLDSASFIQPRCFDLGNAIEGRAAQEFPLMYFLAAQWDQKIGVYRSATANWFHFSFLGTSFLIFLIYWIRSIPSRKFAYLIMPPILGMAIWTGGLLQYYGMNNFPDSAAIASTLLGFVFFQAYLNKVQPILIILATAFFTLAGLFKVSFLVFPIALYGMHIILPLRKSDRIILLLHVTFICISALLWIWYIKSYNATYQSSIFLSTIMPIWEESAEQRMWIWQRLVDEYFDLLLNWEWIFVFLLLFLINLWYSPFRQKLILLVLTVGILILMLLFYAQLSVHSYYLLIWVSFLLLNAYYFSINMAIKWPHPTWIWAVLYGIGFAFLVGQMHSTKKYLENNYKPENQHHSYLQIPPEYLDEELMKSIFDELNIPANSKIISTSDWSFNITLHTCKRMGWTLSWKEFSTEKVKELKQQGAAYLIYWGVHDNLEHSDLNCNRLQQLESGTAIYGLED